MVDDQGAATSRRDLLKKTALAGVWAAPTLQVVNMSQALAGSVAGSAVPPTSTTRAPMVETYSFIGHVNRPNPCTGERVEGPETTTLVVETRQTSVDVLITVRVTLEGGQLFDESGNRYRISISGSETFTSPLDENVFAIDTEEWSSDEAPSFRYLDGVHRVFMQGGRPVRHLYGGGSGVCLG